MPPMKGHSRWGSTGGSAPGSPGASAAAASWRHAPGADSRRYPWPGRLWRGREIEKWGDGIRLLGEWGFFDRPEPRLAHIRWIRPIESLVRTLRIYHFHLGEAGGNAGTSCQSIQNE